MKLLACLIIEDDEPVALALKNQLTILALFNQITISSSPEAAFSQLTRHRFDLVFLDVKLGESNGLDLLRSAAAGMPPVVVMSAHRAYAVDSFELDVADYLLKPFTQTRLLKAINRALGIAINADSLSTGQAIFLRAGRRLQKFPFHEIDFIEAYGIYAKIHYVKHIEVVNEPISTIEKRLPPQLFRRVHKSYIVNLEHITAYNQNNFFVDDEKIPIGVSYRVDLPNIFNALR